MTGCPPVIILLADGRKAQLKEPVAYHGADSVSWPVPSGSLLDGASIPQPFWSLIGGPFEGMYRDASIVHDYYCDHHERSWQDTARMFYAAMRCSGVGEIKAKIMFYAVYRFGPRWPDPLESLSEPSVPAEALDDINAASLVRDAQIIREQVPALDAIERMADAHAQAT